MSTNVEIRVPLWVKTEYLCMVIAKILGHKMNFQGDGDVSKPSQKGNNWSICFAESPKLAETSLFKFGTLMIQIIFKDPCENSYHWFCHLETSEEGYKLLSPKASVEAIAIGKKIIDFFGGVLLFSDCSDEDDLNNVYKIKKPIFSKKRKNQDSDDRYFQFYNTLKEFPALTVEEMDWADKHASYTATDRCLKLKDYLAVLEGKEKLEQSLPLAQSPIKTKNKI